MLSKEAAQNPGDNEFGRQFDLFSASSERQSRTSAEESYMALVYYLKKASHYSS